MFPTPRRFANQQPSARSSEICHSTKYFNSARELVLFNMIRQPDRGRFEGADGC